MWLSCCRAATFWICVQRLSFSLSGLQPLVGIWSVGLFSCWVVLLLYFFFYLWRSWDISHLVFYSTFFALASSIEIKGWGQSRLFLCHCFAVCCFTILIVLELVSSYMHDWLIYLLLWSNNGIGFFNWKLDVGHVFWAPYDIVALCTFFWCCVTENSHQLCMCFFVQSRGWS